MVQTHFDFLQAVFNDSDHPFIINSIHFAIIFLVLQLILHHIDFFLIHCWLFLNLNFWGLFLVLPVFWSTFVSPSFWVHIVTIDIYFWTICFDAVCVCVYFVIVLSHAECVLDSCTDTTRNAFLLALHAFFSHFSISFFDSIFGYTPTHWQMGQDCPMFEYGLLVGVEDPSFSHLLVLNWIT